VSDGLLAHLATRSWTNTFSAGAIRWSIETGSAKGLWIAYREYRAEQRDALLRWKALREIAGVRRILPFFKVWCCNGKTGTQCSQSLVFTATRRRRWDRNNFDGSRSLPEVRWYRLKSQHER
jgi:hypothetical protein